jgi:hypothetical protein
MLRCAIMALAVLGSGLASAQTVIDSSAQAVPAQDVQHVLRLLKDQISDTTGAEVRGLYKASGNGYCGQLKARGAYTDWSPFHANTFTNTVWILSKASNPEAYKEIEARVGIFGCLKRR